jgi:hypothetical protein
MIDNPYMAEEGGRRHRSWGLGCLSGLAGVAFAVAGAGLLGLWPPLSKPTLFALLVGMTIGFYGGLLVGTISAIGWFVSWWRKS